MKNKSLFTMTSSTYNALYSLVYPGSQSDPAQIVIEWLSSQEILRIEPYWRFMGSLPGYSWSKSWEEFSDKTEVDCETWEELLEIALDRSVREALLIR